LTTPGLQQTYRLTATVSKGSPGGSIPNHHRYGTATVDVVVEAARVPTTAIEGPATVVVLPGSSSVSIVGDVEGRTHGVIADTSDPDVPVVSWTLESAAPAVAAHAACVAPTLDRSALAAVVFVSPVAQPTIRLDAAALPAGATYGFRLSSAFDAGRLGDSLMTSFADVAVVKPAAPAGGSVAATPTSGVAMQTSFRAAPTRPATCRSSTRSDTRT